MNDTVEDQSSVAEPTASTPAVVLLGPAALAVPAIGVVQLGRRVVGGDVAATIDDERVSREHARVEWLDDGWRIADLGSRNGTFVDGVPITGEVHRRGDTVVRLGHTVFVLLRDGRGHGAAAPDDGAPVVGPELARVYAAIRAHAIAGDALLVHGDSGSGKELAARLFHDTRTPGKPFVAVNCATIPEGVAERVLFGSRRGAFSGAVDATGFVQAAHGGTLFLDEIADVHPAVQAKLLRVLEAREVVPIGATSPVAVDIAVVAASHRELRGAVADKVFREDLYYRLARAVVRIPPLRARKVDAARLLVRELAAVGCVAHAKLIEACLLRPWPGNVRELCAAARDAAQQARLAGRTLVRPEDLPPHAGRELGAGVPAAHPAAPPQGPERVLDRAGVEDALARAHGVVSVAARELGMHRTQLYRLMARLGISRDDS